MFVLEEKGIKDLGGHQKKASMQEVIAPDVELKEGKMVSSV